jgi:hypothetical protein
VDKRFIVCSVTHHGETIGDYSTDEDPGDCTDTPSRYATPEEARAAVGRVMAERKALLERLSKR